MNTMKEITECRAALKAEQAEREASHTKWRESVTNELKDLAKRELILTRGIDIERLDHGQAVIEVRGKVSDVRHGAYPDQRRPNVRAQVVTDARDDLTRGAITLRKDYLGVKNYDRFGDQRADCLYGSGPRHGSIVFSIRLTEDVRKRLNDGGELATTEIEDALYVLATLDIVERAESEDAA